MSTTKNFIAQKWFVYCLSELSIANFRNMIGNELEVGILLNKKSEMGRTKILVFRHGMNM